MSKNGWFFGGKIMKWSLFFYLEIDYFLSQFSPQIQKMRIYATEAGKEVQKNRKTTKSSYLLIR